MATHKIKLPHRFVSLGDTFNTLEGALRVYMIDRGRDGFCILKLDADAWEATDKLPLETLAELQGKKAEEPEPAKAAAE